MPSKYWQKILILDRIDQNDLIKDMSMSIDMKNYHQK